MRNAFVSCTDGSQPCRARKHWGRSRIVTGLICSIRLSMSLVAEPQDSPPQAPAGSQPQSAPAEPPRRALPAPLDGVFPSSDYLAPTPLIGVPDTDPVWPLTQALWDEFPALKKSKIKVYGWVNAGGDASTSNNSNIPESYAIVPNKLEMDQAVLRFERVPDTVQADHIDWGFRLTILYGIDYRWTTSQGWFSEQLLKRNSLYGTDPVEAYGLVYIPGVAQGMVLKVG